RLLAELQPKAYLFENVPNMKSFDDGAVFEDLRTKLSEAQYRNDHSIISAARYGVPQLRTRLFVAGSKTQGMSLRLSEGSIEKDAYTSVRDAFENLPTDLDAVPEGGPYTLQYEGATQSWYGRLMRSGALDGSVANCIPTHHSAAVATRLDALAPGAIDTVS